MHMCMQLLKCIKNFQYMHSKAHVNNHMHTECMSTCTHICTRAYVCSPFLSHMHALSSHVTFIRICLQVKINPFLPGYWSIRNQANNPLQHNSRKTPAENSCSVKLQINSLQTQYKFSPLRVAPHTPPNQLSESSSNSSK